MICVSLHKGRVAALELHLKKSSKTRCPNPKRQPWVPSALAKAVFDAIDGFRISLGPNKGPSVLAARQGLGILGLGRVVRLVSIIRDEGLGSSGFGVVTWGSGVGKVVGVASSHG